MTAAQNLHVIEAAGVLRALESAGVSPFTPRRALEEMERRRCRSAVRAGRLTAAVRSEAFEVGLVGVIEIEPETLVLLAKASRADLIASAEYVSRRYLARREPRRYLLDVLVTAAALVPLLPADDAVVGDVLTLDVLRRRWER